MSSTKNSFSWFVILRLTTPLNGSCVFWQYCFIEFPYFIREAIWHEYNQCQSYSQYPVQSRKGGAFFFKGASSQEKKSHTWVFQPPRVSSESTPSHFIGIPFMHFSLLIPLLALLFGKHVPKNLVCAPCPLWCHKGHSYLSWVNINRPFLIIIIY